MNQKALFLEFKESMVQKLRDVRHEDIPEINNPKIIFPVLEGDKLMKEVLNGGYTVHPAAELEEVVTPLISCSLVSKRKP